MKMRLELEVSPQNPLVLNVQSVLVSLVISRLAVVGRQSKDSASSLSLKVDSAAPEPLG